MKKLNFLRYRIEELALKQPDEFSEEISVSLSSKVQMHSENEATVNIRCDLQSEDERFNLVLALSGEFRVEEGSGEDEIPDLDNQSLLRQNSLAILFPYLRAAVSQVTSIGYHDPVVLPPVNILEFIKNSNEGEDSER